MLCPEADARRSGERPRPGRAALLRKPARKIALTGGTEQGGPASAARSILPSGSDGSPKVHFLGLCGKGMGAIAAALAREGWRITGSDEAVYPPMDDYLAAAGIAVRSPFDGRNIPDNVDLVVVGKRIRQSNPELEYAIGAGLPYRSFPALLRDGPLRHSRNAVVAGGVGKTTTTAMLAWILESAGRQPDYLIGGFARNFAEPARLAGAGFAVIEGDEYASCFDDPGPKFLKYNPEVALVTNVIEDHPDLYAEAGAVKAVFEDLVRILPRDGCLIVPDDDDDALALAAACRSTVVRVGASADATHRIDELELLPTVSRFRFMDADFAMPLVGRMNVMNGAMAAAAAGHLGVPAVESAEALAGFRGVVNRQETRRVGRFTLLSDKASHPLALRCLFESARQRFPDRRIVSLIRPRATGGRKWVYQCDLPGALGGVDLVVLLPAYEHNPEPDRSWPGGPFSMELLESELVRKGQNVIRLESDDALADALRRSLRTDDVVVVTLPEQDLDTAASLVRILGELA